MLVYARSGVLASVGRKRGEAMEYVDAGDMPDRDRVTDGAMRALSVLDVAGPSLDLAISAWLDAKARRSESVKTATAYRETITHFRACLHSLGLDVDSRARDVALAAQAWATRRASGEGMVSAATSNQRLAILSSFYDFGRKRELLTCENPISQVERRRVQAYAKARPLPRAVTDGRLAEIDRATLDGLRDYALIYLALTTGRRSAELRGLTCGDLACERTSGTATRTRRIARIVATWKRTKGGKVMLDALTPATVAALLAYLQALYGGEPDTLAADLPVFVSLSRNSYKRPMGKQAIANIYARRLGTSKVHATRHTFARNMEDVGAKVSEIQKRLGHTSLETTGRYLAGLSSDENSHAADLDMLYGNGNGNGNGATNRARRTTQPLTKGA